MHEISIVTDDVNRAMIKPIRERLGNHLCYCYGMVAPRHLKRTRGERLILSTIPFIISKLVSILAKYNFFPDYYTYFYKIKAIDYVFSRRASYDESKVLYVSPLFVRTVAKAKKKGKIVVVLAGNSEPEREHNRIMAEYERFGVTHRYIYGDRRYASICKESFRLSDFIISISKVSWNTYELGGYNMNKFKLIPLTGTDFPIQQVDAENGKKKAFITTAFHCFIKGTQRLLLAWQKAGIKDVPLIIVGRLCDDIKEFVAKYGPFDNVCFLGYVKGSLVDFYGQYDAVGVLLSLSEGAVRTTPELMSFGYPMVVSPDASCDIVDNNCGFIVDPTNEEEIAEKLSWFAEDWSRVHQMRSKVLSSVSRRTLNDFAFECADYLLQLSSSIK